MAHPVGRPTKYTDEMPAKILEFMGKGRSVERFASSIGVHKDTLYEWVKVHPEFSVAFKLAKQDCEVFWEDWLVNNFIQKKGQTVNSNLVKLFMTNRFGWTEKKETTHGG